MAFSASLQGEYASLLLDLVMDCLGQENMMEVVAFQFQEFLGSIACFYDLPCFSLCHKTGKLLNGAALSALITE